MPHITAAQVKILRRLCEAGTALIDADKRNAVVGGTNLPDETIRDFDSALTDGYRLLAAAEKRLRKDRKRDRARRHSHRSVQDDTPELDDTFHRLEMEV